MFDAEGRPVAKYWLENAWPSKLEIVGRGAALLERLTLTAEHLQRIPPR